ncbi:PLASMODESMATA CALLOSE-BINDING PROTEIN [Salix suchowensis]|nr:PLASMODESMATA CALLOSE-BINDING PROTEIN [Salix suchowensis]
MALLVLAILMAVMTGRASCTWCVCKEMSSAVLQQTLDYACGAGADCNPIHKNAPCFQPDTVRAHCNYAVNSYFQKKGQAQGACDFKGAATISTSDPSVSGCSYPSSISAAGTSTTPASGTSTTPVTTNPSNTTPSTATPSTTATPTGTTTPYSATPTGVLGGIGNGVGPSGAGINTDITDAGFRIENTGLFSLIIAVVVSGLMF